MPASTPPPPAVTAGALSPPSPRLGRCVMFVGVPPTVVAECARALAPLEVLRVRHERTAAVRMRIRQPLAVVLGDGVSSVERRKIRDVGADRSTRIITAVEPEMIVRHVRLLQRRADAVEDS